LLLLLSLLREVGKTVISVRATFYSAKSIEDFKNKLMGWIWKNIH
jgi:hypothetical protein